MPKCCNPSTKAATAASDTGFRTTPNRPQAPEKSRFHRAWPGSPSSGGIEDAGDFRPGLQPAGQGERGLLMARQADRQGAQARAGPGSNRRRWHKAPGRHGPGAAGAAWLSLARDIAQHHIGMAADIFGGRLDGEIDAMLERLERTAASPRYCPSAPRRRPAIVVGMRALAMAGISWTSKVSEPGLSQNTALVLGLR